MEKKDIYTHADGGDTKLTSAVVISFIKDKKIQDHIKDSPIWTNAFHEDEITTELYQTKDSWYKYSIKFNGLTPVQCTNIETFKLNKK